VNVGERSFAVGVASIDAMHVEFEQRVQALQDAGDNARLELDAFEEHLRRHFEHEQALMAACGFPMEACHVREHATVLEVVAEVKRLSGAGEFEPLRRLAPAMLEWFAIHAGSMDAALAEHLNGNTPTAA
jgi:hemerythrin-like metal-binding protein